MKTIAGYLCLFVCLCGRAQQTSLYTQYIFNKAGVNPAASGTDINQKYNYVVGVNRQWLGFEHAPKENFANFSMTTRPPRSYHLWQNVGVYLENNETGVFTNSGVYFNYTLHLLVRKTWVASFGAYAGLRAYFVSNGSLDRNDPANQGNSARTLMYPDIMPGFRLSNKKIFIDVSARQLTTNYIKDFNGNRIGSPSQLQPVLFFAFGRRIPLSDAFLVMPSVALNATVLHIPAVDLNVMAYYLNKVGAGAALRNLNFLSVICQVRIFSNLTAGMAYSYSLNMARYAAPNSFELMLGITPFGMSERISGRHSIARCPALTF